MESAGVAALLDWDKDRTERRGDEVTDDRYVEPQKVAKRSS
jgi:hypothetical protein